MATQNYFLILQGYCIMSDSNFLIDYLKNRGMQNMTKQEYEQILFYWMFVKEKIFGDKNFTNLDSKSLYDIADELGLEITKVKQLVKKMPYVRDSEQDARTFVNLGKFFLDNIDSLSYSPQDNTIFMSLENPIQYDLVKRSLAISSVTYDTSFSKNIIKIPFRKFGEFFEEDEKKILIDKLKESMESLMNRYPEKIDSTEMELLKKETKFEKAMNVIDRVLQSVGEAVNIGVSAAQIYNQFK